MSDYDEAVALLVKARDLMSKGWCQGNIAQNIHGDPCDYSGEDAVSYCSLGALYKASDKLSNLGMIEAEILLRRIGVDNVISFNDTHTKEQVLDAFDKAIRYGEQQ